jgi:pyrroline-5-carboxylate reductase
MKLGFIGIGKIASAVIEGLCTSKARDLEIFLSPRNEKASVYLAGKYPPAQSGKYPGAQTGKYPAAQAGKYPVVRRMESNQEVLDNSDVVIIALRPAVAVDILKTLSFQTRHTVISLIPLLKYAGLSAAVQPAGIICRAIPLPGVMEHNCPIPLFRAPEAVVDLFGLIGQPLPVADEEQLHAIWTLTGLITPFYDLLGELSAWTISHGVEEKVANTYIADLFQSLSYLAQRAKHIDFAELAQHAATPNGMNEQAGKEIREKGAHAAWREASDRLLERFE